MRSSNWIAAALLMSGLTASAAQPAWVHEKENGRIEILDPAGGKRAVLTLHAPGKVTVRKIENRCFSIQTDFAGKIIPGVYGIRNGKENSFDFFWKLEGEWSRRIGSGAFVFSLDPSLRGKTLFFLEENGKQSTVSLPQEKNLTRWLRPPFNRKIVQRIDVPLSSGTLRIDGAGCEVACMVYGYNSGDFRLFPKNGYLQGEVTIQYLPFLITPIDISPAANRSFADDVADDGKGGWTDQGKQQDLSQFKEKQLALAKEKIEKIEKLAENVNAGDMHELMFVYELKERLTVCKSVIAHLFARKETRWHSFDENLDYPKKSGDWLKYVNSKMEDGKITVFTRKLVGREEHYEHHDESGAL